MILIPNNQCGDDLVVKIESQYEDWSFIYDIVKEVEITISTSPHDHPIPYGTKITDHVERQMDTMRITGLVSCFRCGGVSTIPAFVISRLKQLSERMMYCKEDFILLTSNHWQFRYAILTEVSIRESQDGVHTKQISTSWVGANLTGSIRNPFFQRGGIVF